MTCDVACGLVAASLFEAILGTRNLLALADQSREVMISRERRSFEKRINYRQLRAGAPDLASRLANERKGTLSFVLPPRGRVQPISSLLRG